MSCRPSLSPSSLPRSLNIRSHTELEHALPFLSAYYTCCPVAALPSRSKATSSQYHQEGSAGAQPSGKKMKVTLLLAIASERVPQFHKDCDPETTGHLSPFFTVDGMKHHVPGTCTSGRPGYFSSR